MDRAASEIESQRKLHPPRIAHGKCFAEEWAEIGIRPWNSEIGMIEYVKCLGQRNSIDLPSRTMKRRCSARSITSLPGPGRMSRPASPNVKGAGSENACSVKQMVGVAFARGQVDGLSGYYIGPVGRAGICEIGGEVDRIQRRAGLGSVKFPLSCQLLSTGFHTGAAGME